MSFMKLASLQIEQFAYEAGGKKDNSFFQEVAQSVATPLGHSNLSAMSAGKPAESRLSLEEITAILNGAPPGKAIWSHGGCHLPVELQDLTCFLQKKT